MGIISFDGTARDSAMHARPAIAILAWCRGVLAIA